MRKDRCYNGRMKVEEKKGMFRWMTEGGGAELLKMMDGWRDVSGERWRADCRNDKRGGGAMEVCFQR